jgi:hypothetical protein
MARRLMTDAQGSTPPAWVLAAGRARRIPAHGQPTCLRVVSGRLWLTADPPGAGGDHWLGAGERWPLPPGVSAVVEGWPEAAFELLLAPVPQPAPGWFRIACRVRAWWRRRLPRGALPTGAA